MGNIVLLDELTINKIAAGEVIERPASVIKELVENSIDAGANNITVDIKNGGISCIKITDNGKGIAPDDLELAFERHATSKIRNAEDLNVVTSMGFRGEALASVAAISNVEMISKPADQDIGYKIIVEAGNVLTKEEAGCQNGTSITVKNLFFNTPVRYKFLKKDYTETGYIEDVITRIALVNPHIAIKLINSGKTLIQTNGNGDLKSVIYSIYGKDIAKAILPIEYTYEDIKIEGIIGKPEIARSNRANQLFFVNNRYIKDKTVSAAVEQAFKGMIPIGKYGFVIINITIDPSKVDVNVHPAKLEVRFQDENTIFQAIYHGIKDTLLKNDLVANTKQNNVFEEKQQKDNINNNTSLFSNKEREEKIKSYNDQESKIKTNLNVGKGGPINTADVLEELKKVQDNLKQEIDNDSILSDFTTQENNVKDNVIEDEKNEIKENNVEENQKVAIENNKNLKDEEGEIEENSNNNVEKSNDQELIVSSEKNEKEEEEEEQSFEEMYAKLFGTKPISSQESDDNENDEKNKSIKNEFNVIDLLNDNISVFDNNERYNQPIYKFIGIIFNTYIIIEMEQEMYIIDQHAAHERIMYEKVKNNYYSDTNKDSQMLLLPDIITLTHKEMDIAKENFDMFKKAGFELEEFGENTIKLTGVPTICIDLNTKELFLETLDEINAVARTAKQEKEEKFIATVACKAAVKANMVLTKEEVQSLMDKLLELPNPFTCPHGRPTAIKMSKYDIEKKFDRK